MTVIMNMAVVARLENPFRLSSFRAGWETNGFAEGGNEQEGNDRYREDYNKHSCYQTYG